MAYRIANCKTNCRLREIRPCEIRKIMREHTLGMQCIKCLNKLDSNRYCCKEHADYYRAITNCFYGTNYPHDIDTAPRDPEGYITIYKVVCKACGKEAEWGIMSIDHIHPITKGGLEFDRDNLQWMCLVCNIKKSNHTEEDRIKKEKIRNAQQKLFDNGKGSVVVKGADIACV